MVRGVSSLWSVVRGGGGGQFPVVYGKGGQFPVECGKGGIAV